MFLTFCAFDFLCCFDVHAAIAYLTLKVCGWPWTKPPQRMAVCGQGHCRDEGVYTKFIQMANISTDFWKPSLPTGQAPIKSQSDVFSYWSKRVWCCSSLWKQPTGSFWGSWSMNSLRHVGGQAHEFWQTTLWWCNNDATIHFHFGSWVRSDFNQGQKSRTLWQWQQRCYVQHPRGASTGKTRTCHVLIRFTSFYSQ